MYAPATADTQQPEPQPHSVTPKPTRTHLNQENYTYSSNLAQKSEEWIRSAYCMGHVHGLHASW